MQSIQPYKAKVKLFIVEYRYILSTFKDVNGKPKKAIKVWRKKSRHDTLEQAENSAYHSKIKCPFNEYRIRYETLQSSTRNL